MFDGKSITYQQATVRNDGFWPDISAGDFERGRSIPATLDHGTVLNALLTAVAEINLSLSTTRARYEAQGYLQAENVPGPVAVLTDGGDDIAAGRTHLTALYIRAVYARAKADLLPEMATLGRRETHPGQEAPETRRGLLTEATLALQTIQKRPRGSVSLID